MLLVNLLSANTLLMQTTVAGMIRMVIITVLVCSISIKGRAFGSAGHLMGPTRSCSLSAAYSTPSCGGKPHFCFQI
jgi:hypothetical protein